MNNGCQKSNGCNADKEGGKFFKTFFYPKAQSKHVCPLAYNESISVVAHWLGCALAWHYRLYNVISIVIFKY